MTKEAMTEGVIAALGECVSHGLDQGWIQVHQAIRQPSKKQLLDALYLGVMQKLLVLLEQVK